MSKWHQTIISPDLLAQYIEARAVASRKSCTPTSRRHWWKRWWCRLVGHRSLPFGVCRSCSAQLDPAITERVMGRFQ